MDQEQFELEKEKLSQIIEQYREIMDYYDAKLKAIPRLYANNSQMMENMLMLYSQKQESMNKNINKPYFARIDFLRDGENKEEKIYIGRVGVMDEDNNVITVDWRAPISSMYYDSNLGKTSYIAPEGVCKGELLVKRQFEIEDKKLISYQDVDTVSNDELLKPYLGTNADNRLKNIVSTIQREQNDIIRESLYKNIIVQGVAGSGKTTVALHRIAYLVYNNRETTKADQYMVIGPNKFFVDYISSVLPDLDVNNVKQLTYDELCSEIIKEKIELINEEEKLKKSITKPEELDYQNLKVSMKFKLALDKYITEIDQNIIPNKGIEIKQNEIISNDFIKEIYFDIKNNSIYNCIDKKLERTKLMLQKYVADNYEEISRKLDFHCSENELEKLSTNSIKKYFSNLIPKITKLYCDFLENIDKYISVHDNLQESIGENIKNNISNIKKGKVEFEDLSALIYLACKTMGTDNYNKYRQIAIDEAQDYGQFSFYALKKMFNEATFSIFGDLAQSIYQYRGISNWDDVADVTFKNKCDIKMLLKSYRTTAEIMNQASKITEHINMNSAQPVIRHGEDVRYQKYYDIKEKISIIIQNINKYKENGYQSIAIICKDEEEANLINKYINSNNNFEVKNVVSAETKYEGGICTITSYLAKGLEFDAVIISNASENIYNSNKTVDMKLLYVAMTRPLHELLVLYQDMITKPLE